MLTITTSIKISINKTHLKCVLLKLKSTAENFLYTNEFKNKIRTKGNQGQWFPNSDS